MQFLLEHVLLACARTHTYTGVSKKCNAIFYIKEEIKNAIEHLVHQDTAIHHMFTSLLSHQLSMAAFLRMRAYTPTSYVSAEW